MSALGEETAGEVGLLGKPQRTQLFETVFETAKTDLAKFGLTERTKKTTKVLGWGANGIVYSMPSDLILKVTRDESEAALATRLEHEEDPIRGFPEVYYCAHGPYEAGALSKMREDRGFEPWFAIVMERSIHRSTMDLDTKHSFEKMTKVLHGQLDESELNDLQKLWLDDLVSAGAYISGVDLADEDERDALIYMLSEETYDMHVDNLGLLKRDGRLMAVVLDLGQGVELYEQPVDDDGTTGSDPVVEFSSSYGGRAVHGQYTVPLAKNRRTG